MDVDCGLTSRSRPVPAVCRLLRDEEVAAPRLRSRNGEAVKVESLRVIGLVIMLSWMMINLVVGSGRELQ